MSTDTSSAAKTTQTPEANERRDAILQQSILTFAELGYRGTDVQVIADRAGVGKGTVYRHFGTKEELFWTTAFEVFQRMREHLLAAEQAASGTIAKLRAATRAYGEFFDDNPAYLEVFVQDRAEFRGTGPAEYQQHHEALLNHFVALVEAGIASGELRPVDARRTMIALSGFIHGIVVESCYTVHGLPMREVIEHGVEIFLAGLQPEGAKA